MFWPQQRLCSDQLALFQGLCGGTFEERNRISTSICNVDRDPHTGETSLEAFLYLFFSPSQRSQAAGRAFWERRRPQDYVDPPSSPQTMAAHLAATNDWRQIKGGRFAELKRIGHPTLVVNGSNDIMVPTINSFTLSQRIPNAQLIVYPTGPRAAVSVSGVVRRARANVPR